jgi:hypothetical protein
MSGCFSCNVRLPGTNIGIQQDFLLHVAAILSSLLPDETVSDCALIRQVSSLCGCTIIPNSCSLCADGSKAPNIHVEFEEFAGITYLPVK